MRKFNCIATVVFGASALAGCNVIDEAPAFDECDDKGCEGEAFGPGAPAPGEDQGEGPFVDPSTTPPDPFGMDTPPTAGPAIDPPDPGGPAPGGPDDPAGPAPCDGCERVIRGYYEIAGSETWARGSRVRLEAGATVVVRGDLTIEPDVHVRMAPEAMISVEGGALDASGDAADPVRFFGTQPGCGAWGGVTAYGGRSSLRLRHAEVVGSSRGVESSGASLTLERVRIEGVCAPAHSQPDAYVGASNGVFVMGGNASFWDVTVRDVRGRSATAGTSASDLGYGGQAYGVQVMDARVDEIDGLTIESIEGGAGFDTGVLGEGGGGWAVGLSIMNAPPLTEIGRLAIRGVRGGDGFGHGGEAVGAWLERIERVSMENVLVSNVRGGDGVEQNIWGAYTMGGSANGLRGYSASLDLEHATVHGVFAGEGGDEPGYWDGMSGSIYVDGSAIGERTRVAYSALTHAPGLPPIALGFGAQALLERNLFHGVETNAPTNGIFYERENTFADPMYADPAAGDFTPAEGSPLVDAAGERTAAADVRGFGRDELADIGAFEYVE
jgi:hypothetical protein